MMRIRFTPSSRLLRGIIAAVLGVTLSIAVTVALASRRTARTTARLNSAATRLDSLTDGDPDNPRRAAIAWGYAERLRLGLESPFRLIETAARDTRLSADERWTVSWALLAHVVRGETAEIDPAALDGIGPGDGGSDATTGSRHLEFIRETITAARNPRAGELALRMAYTLAVSERIVDNSAPVLVAQAAALIGDAEIARREAAGLVRATGGADPVTEIRRRRARHTLYVEQPTLLAEPDEMQREAVATVPALLDSIRLMRGDVPAAAAMT